MWEADVNDWKQTDIELYKVYLSESEKLLKEVIDDSEKITNRAYSLINILIPIITVILGYIINNLLNSQDFKVVVSMILLCPILYSFYLFFSLIKKRLIYRNGTEPKIIFIPEYVDNKEWTDEEKKKRILLFVIEQNQEKIKRNEELNVTRIKRYQKGIQTLFVTFIVSVIAIALLKLFFYCTNTA